MSADSDSELWLSAAQVARKLKVSRRTFDRVTRHMPGFPAPLRLSPKVIRWKWPAVEAWCDAQADYSSRAISSALSA